MERWKVSQRRLAAIRDAKRKLESQAAGEEDVVVDKKRRAGDTLMWGEIVAQSERLVGSSHQQEAGVSGGSRTTKGKNPWARVPSIDAKKVVR